MKGPQAALALIKRHVPLRHAHAAVTALFDGGEAIVDVPVLDNAQTLVRELAKCNVVASLLKAESATAGR